MSAFMMTGSTPTISARTTRPSTSGAAPAAGAGGSTECQMFKPRDTPRLIVMIRIQTARPCLPGSSWVPTALMTASFRHYV